jgi:hypothetical protein
MRRRKWSSNGGKHEKVVLPFLHSNYFPHPFSCILRLLLLKIFPSILLLVCPQKDPNTERRVERQTLDEKTFAQRILCLWQKKNNLAGI